jgi:hypothetical protein
MPLTGMTLHEVFWQLPAAIAYQFQFVYLQMQGADLVMDSVTDPALLARLKKARLTRARR